jgi:hypothetical protein
VLGRVQAVEGGATVVLAGEGRFPRVPVADVDPAGIPGVDPVHWAWFLASEGYALESAIALAAGRASREAEVLSDLLARAGG